MKKLVLIMVLNSFCFGACIDIGVMQVTAKIARSTYEATDKVLAKIINQVKSNENDSKEDNIDTLSYLKDVQGLDTLSAINNQELFFNSQIISELEALATDNQAEETNFELSKELEELLK